MKNLKSTVGQINKNIVKYNKKSMAWQNCYRPFTHLWHLVHFTILKQQITDSIKPSKKE
jgi:hypothetical protein